MKKLIYFLSIFLQTTLWAQTPNANDSLETRQLKQVTVKGYRLTIEPILHLPDVHQTYLMAGKKNEVISLVNLPANLAEKQADKYLLKFRGLLSMIWMVQETRSMYQPVDWMPTAAGNIMCGRME